MPRSNSELHQSDAFAQRRFYDKPLSHRLRVYLRRYRPHLKKASPYVMGFSHAFSFLYLWLLCLVIVAFLEAHAFKLVSNNLNDGFAIFQAFAFLAALLTLFLSLGNRPTFRWAGLGFGAGALGIDQAGDLVQKFYAGSTAFKDQAVQVFLWVQIGSGALVLATTIALAYVAVMGMLRWTWSKLRRRLKGKQPAPPQN